MRRASPRDILVSGPDAMMVPVAAAIPAFRRCSPICAVPEPHDFRLKDSVPASLASRRRTFENTSSLGIPNDARSTWSRNVSRCSLVDRNHERLIDRWENRAAPYYWVETSTKRPQRDCRLMRCRRPGLLSRVSRTEYHRRCRLNDRVRNGNGCGPCAPVASVSMFSKIEAGAAGLEPATSGLTVRRSAN